MSLVINPTGAITAGTSVQLGGSTLADVVSDVATRDEVGSADCHYGLNYAHANGLITTVELTLDLSIDLPVWSNASSRPQAEQDEWSRFLRALRAHEDGHIDIFRTQAATMYERLRHARRSTIERVFEAEKARIQRLNDAYDHRTDHGRRQQTPHGSTVITVPP